MLEIYAPSSPIRWTWITISGADTMDFLHRLTTINVRELEKGRGSKGFLLNAGGKILAYFTLWNLGSPGLGEYAFEFDAGIDVRWKRELLSTIDRFTFSEKMTLAEATQLSSRWIFPGRTEVPGTRGLRAGRMAESDGVRLCHHGSKDFGTPWLTAWGEPKALSSWVAKLPGPTRDLTSTDCTRMRIEALSPWIDAEITDSTIPLEVGLREAVAENKGCYPGQEVIEKIISLGAPPRRLVAIEGKGEPPTAHAALLAGSAEIGQVTSVSPSADNSAFTALALVRKTHLQTELEVRFKEQSGAVGRIKKIDN